MKHEQKKSFKSPHAFHIEIYVLCVTGNSPTKATTPKDEQVQSIMGCSRQMITSIVSFSNDPLYLHGQYTATHTETTQHTVRQSPVLAPLGHGREKVPKYPQIYVTLSGNINHDWIPMGISNANYIPDHNGMTTAAPHRPGSLGRGMRPTCSMVVLVLIARTKLDNTGLVAVR